jgi:hypothetical protein
MTKQTVRKQRPRYYRQKGAFSGLTLRDVDQLILRLVYAHRFLDTELLLHLLAVRNAAQPEYREGRDGKERPTRYGFGLKALYTRLQALFHAKYLDRHFLTDRPMGPGHGSPRAIYGLGPASAKIVGEMAGITYQEVQDIIESNKVKGPFLRHALQTAKFRVILELACQQSDGQVRILFWEQGQHLRDKSSGLNHENDTEDFSVYPDAFFGIEVVGQGKANYFLEIDRGTMPIAATGPRSDLRKKFYGYWYYHRGKLHQRRYYYRTLPDGQVVGINTELDPRRGRQLQLAEPEIIKGFRVLFIVPGVITADGTATGRMGNILSLFPTFPHVHRGTSLFWFAAPEQFTLSEPATIFSHAWITPNPERGLESLVIRG